MGVSKKTTATSPQSRISHSTSSTYFHAVAPVNPILSRESYA